MESQTHSKGGRPAKYKPKYADELIAYFEEFVDEPFTKEVVREETSFYKDGVKKSYRVEHKLIAKRLPTLFGFARKKGVNYTTVYRWATDRVGQKPENDTKDTRPFKYPEFCNAYNTVLHYQTEFLTAVGLGGLSPAPFAIFTAKNVIKWRDTVDQRFVDGKGNDTAPGGYVLLPAKKTPEEAQADIDAAENEDKM